MLLLSFTSTAGALRGERIDDVPIAVTGVNSELIESSGTVDIAKLNRITIQPFTGGNSQNSPGQAVSIRGVGGIQSSTSLTYINGMPKRPLPDTTGFPLFDIDRVEVLRGPQATLYSRNTISGIIPKTTRTDSWWVTTDPGASGAYGDTRPAQNDYGNYVPGINYVSGDNPFVVTPGNGFVDFSGIENWDLNFAMERYNWWGTTYGRVEWGDIYSSDTGYGKSADSRLWPGFAWANEGNKWVEYKSGGYPDDPLYPEQGSSGKTSSARKAIGGFLGMIGSPVELNKEEASAQWGLPETGFRRLGNNNSAWDVITGDRKNVLVAVIDSGLDLTHADGPKYVWTNPDEIAGNGIDDDSNGYVDDIHGWNFVSESSDITDDHGHGTFVAGIIAAKTNNGEGISGINPGARIMPLKVLNHEGKSRILSVYRAIRYAVDNGARVINLSLGGKGVTRLEQIGINYAYAMGCIVVVAAGNESGDINRQGPPGARRAFSVSAMDMDGKPRESSNHGLNVAVAAPGQSIYSLAANKGNRDGKFMPMMGGEYFRASGTSFSAPFVAATASLIWSKYPDLSNRMVEDMILQSAKDIYDKGWDTHTGYGLLDGHGALSQNPNQLLVPRVTEVYVNKEKRRVSSVDVYGVIRGNLDYYTVSVGRGDDPDAFKKVYGPVSDPVDYRLISRIDGIHFERGDSWTIKVDAVDKNKQIKSIRVLISKDEA